MAVKTTTITSFPPPYQKAIMQTFIENIDGVLLNAADIYKITAKPLVGADNAVITAHVGRPGSPGARDSHDLSEPLTPVRARDLARQLAAMCSQGGTLAIIDGELTWLHRYNDTTIKKEVMKA